MNKPDPDYDANKDLAASFDWAYKKVRERRDAGGPSWKPSAQPQEIAACPPSDPVRDFDS